MPTKVKGAISLAVILLGAGGAWLEWRYADPVVAIVIAALAGFMVVALWLFPEAGVKSSERPPTDP